MPFKHSITRLFDPLLTTKRLVVFDYLGIFETTEGPVASLGQTQKIGLCTFFLFPLGFSQEFLTLWSFSVPRPETENSWFLEGSTGSERFRQKSVLLVKVQQTMKSKKGSPSKWMGRFWFRKVEQARSRSDHHTNVTILWVPTILGQFSRQFHETSYVLTTERRQTCARYEDISSN